MKKEAFIHISFLISFFLFVSIFKGWISISYWPFWVGGLVGNFLADFDHIIYVFFLKPHELTSQRVNYMVGKRRFFDTIDLLSKTRTERTSLIFHSILFQLIFIVLTFFVITSSGSLFGRGLVLSFSLHLLVDQAVDLIENKDLNIWFNNFPLRIPEDKHWAFWGINGLLLIIFGFLM